MGVPRDQPNSRVEPWRQQVDAHCVDMVWTQQCLRHCVKSTTRDLLPSFSDIYCFRVCFCVPMGEQDSENPLLDHDLSHSHTEERSTDSYWPPCRQVATIFAHWLGMHCFDIACNYYMLQSMALALERSKQSKALRLPHSHFVTGACDRKMGARGSRSSRRCVLVADIMSDP